MKKKNHIRRNRDKQKDYNLGKTEKNFFCIVNRLFSITKTVKSAILMTCETA